MVRFVLASTVALVACGGGETEPPLGPGSTEPCEPPRRLVGARCLDPGIADDGCPAGTIGVGPGVCQPAGVLPDGCADGFAHDGDVGCAPILPPEPCGEGLLAVPGEQECHVVMPCGAGRWGDIPVDPTTEYVDAAYAGDDSDGTAAKPWLTITAAVVAAARGASIAIAEGSYVEDVVVESKTVRIFGVCPARVEIAGVGVEVAALNVHKSGAGGTEVHGIALAGAANGMLISGASDVLVDRVWVHGPESRGIAAQNTFGDTSIRVVGTLVEGSGEYGVFLGGAHMTFEGSVVRDTRPRADGSAGAGVHIQLACVDDVCDPTTRSTGTVRGSLIERNHDIGVAVSGSDATIDATVVRDTQPRPSDQGAGRGMAVQMLCTDTSCDPVTRSTATISRSVIDHNHELALLLIGSDVTVSDTVIRDTLPQVSDDLQGRGVSIQGGCASNACDPTARSHVTLAPSVVTNSHEIGVVVSGSDATIESTVVRDTMPVTADQTGGGGIAIQLSCDLAGCDPETRSAVTLKGCLVERNHEIGVFVYVSDAVIESTLVRDTLARPADGLFGDGVSVFGGLFPGAATLTSSLVDRSARAGLASFGAVAALGSTAIRCAGVPLDGESLDGAAADFDDRGANACGCPAADGACHVVSTEIEPPAPVTASE